MKISKLSLYICILLETQISFTMLMVKKAPFYTNQTMINTSQDQSLKKKFRKKTIQKNNTIPEPYTPFFENPAPSLLKLKRIAMQENMSDEDRKRVQLLFNLHKKYKSKKQPLFHGKKTVFHCAAGKKDFHLIRLAATHKKNKSSINKKHNGQTALHIATQNLDVRTVEQLLKSGAQVNCQNNDGKTPLILTTSINYGPENLFLLEQIAELLTAHQANVKIKDNNGNCAVHYLTKQMERTHNQTGRRDDWRDAEIYRTLNRIFVKLGA